MVGTDCVVIKYRELYEGACLQLNLYFWIKIAIINY